MSNKNNKVLKWLLIITVIILTIFTLPFNKIKNASKNFINNIDSFINNFGGFVGPPNNSADHHISNISFYEENASYFAVLTFRSINPKKITSIVINDYEFSKNEFTDDLNNLIVNITPIILETNSTIIKVTVINVSNTKHLSNLETTFYKAVDYELIEERKKSVVGVAAKSSRFSINRTSAWGSGVIFSKSTVIKSGIFNDYTMYEYLILTNSHVINKGDLFYIYNKDENDEYPKSTGFLEPNETVEVLGVYTDKSDLAILKLTTFDDSLIPLDDKQFITRELVPIAVSDKVFLIGSPYTNNQPFFNSYKIGQIKNTSKTITLADTDLCSKGCNSIETTAYLGGGSSGGALFDMDGNLIGIHFAGSEEYQEAFAIPMWQVFNAIDKILGENYLKGSLKTSFFMQLQSRHLKLLY